MKTLRERIISCDSRDEVKELADAQGVRLRGLVDDIISAGKRSDRARLTDSLVDFMAEHLKASNDSLVEVFENSRAVLRSANITILILAVLNIIQAVLSLSTN